MGPGRPILRLTVHTRVLSPGACWLASLGVDSTGGGEGGGEEEEQVLAVKDDYVGVDQNLFQGILVALRGDQDHRVGSFDILVEKSWTILYRMAFEIRSQKCNFSWRAL